MDRIKSIKLKYSGLRLQIVIVKTLQDNKKSKTQIQRFCTTNAMHEQHETQNQRGAHNDHPTRRHFLQSNEKHFELKLWRKDK